MITVTMNRQSGLLKRFSVNSIQKRLSGIFGCPIFCFYTENYCGACVFVIDWFQGDFMRENFELILEKAGFKPINSFKKLKAGDKVAVREKSKSLEAIERSLSNSSAVYEWITWNNDTKEGTFVSVPARLQVPENIKEQLIVELYNK